MRLIKRQNTNTRRHTRRQKTTTKTTTRRRRQPILKGGSMHLLPWIDERKLNWKELSANPNAISILELNQEKIDWSRLSSNPNAIHLLKENTDKIDWDRLSGNPNAIPLLEANKDKIDWEQLSTNPNAMSLLEKNKDKIDWDILSENPNAISLLEKNPTKIDWHALSLNPNAISLLEENQGEIIWFLLSANPNAIPLLEKHPEKIYWTNLSENPNAIHLLEENPEKINWDSLLRNSNAISLLEKHPEKINWDILSANPNAISLLEENPTKINWFWLSTNPSIFTENNSKNSITRKIRSSPLFKRTSPIPIKRTSPLFKHTSSSPVKSSPNFKRTSPTESNIRSICPDSDYCIGFGKETDTIRAFYDNFDFKYVDVTKIKRLGAPSVNGFVNELVYNKNGYETHTVLKSSSEADSDNLFYEGLVGKYINKQVLFFPCFIETYKICGHHTHLQTIDLQKNRPLHNKLEFFEKNINSETYQDLMQSPVPSIETSCLAPTAMCILIQHIKRASTIRARIEHADRYYCYGTLIQHLFQVYAPLSTLMNEYTHYDLHAENVILYNPTVAGDKYIVMKYYNDDGTTTDFKTFEIAKIIDYGRSFFYDKKGPPPTSSSRILNSVMDTPACQTKDNGSDCGYNILHDEDTPGSFYYISSNKRNASHDLRLLSTIQQIIQFSKQSEFGQVLNELVYSHSFGTKELLRKQFSTLGDNIYNVSDAYEAMKYLINTSILFKECEKHLFSGKTQLGTMEIWLDRSQPMIYTPV